MICLIIVFLYFKEINLICSLQFGHCIVLELRDFVYVFCICEQFTGTQKPVQQEHTVMTLNSPMNIKHSKVYCIQTKVLQYGWLWLLWMRSNVRKRSSPQHGQIESANDVALASIISDVICGFFRSKETTFSVHRSASRLTARVTNLIIKNLDTNPFQ